MTLSSLMSKRLFSNLYSLEKGSSCGQMEGKAALDPEHPLLLSRVGSNPGLSAG